MIAIQIWKSLWIEASGILRDVCTDLSCAFHATVLTPTRQTSIAKLLKWRVESAARRLERELSRELRTMQTEEIRFGAVRAIEIARESLHGQNFKIRLHEEGMGELEATIREALNEIKSELDVAVFELKTDIERAEVDGRKNRKRRFKVRSAN